MIIMLNKLPINQHAANMLAKFNGYNEQIVSSTSRPDLSNVKDTTVTFLDVTANREFQTLSSPDLFADKLVDEMHLPTTVTRLNFLISDMNPKKSLGVFVEGLSDCLPEAYKHLQIHFIADFDSEYTLVSPPDVEGGNWKVYGFTKAELINIPLNFKAIKERKYELIKQPNIYPILKHHKDKKPLWEGKDIHEWFNHYTRTIRLKRYLPVSEHFKFL